MNGSNTEIFDATVAIVSDLFGIDPATIDMATMKSSITEWDSLQHVNLVIDLEQHFQVQFSESEVSSIQGIFDLVDLIIRAIKRHK